MSFAIEHPLTVLLISGVAMWLAYRLWQASRRLEEILADVIPFPQREET